MQGAPRHHHRLRPAAAHSENGTISVGFQRSPITLNPNHGLSGAPGDLPYKMSPEATAYAAAEVSGSYAVPFGTPGIY